MSVHVAVVGVGKVAHNYLPAMAEQEDVTLSYYNRSPQKAIDAAEMYGGRVASSMAELMAGDPDTVLVLTRETERLEVANALLEHAPRRLFFEKPLVAARGQADVNEEDFFVGAGSAQAGRRAACRDGDGLQLPLLRADAGRQGHRCRARFWQTGPLHGAGPLRMLEPLHRPDPRLYGSGTLYQRAGDAGIRSLHGQRRGSQRGGDCEDGERRHRHDHRHLRRGFQSAAL
ncbi:MAG: Gfo/Idh/MocA family oxidoreductase [Caldilineaceae bacterium]|nr:Gfo/Idh/MocA family oxidoreductase [Caldilineaceae bacterium]